MFFIGTIIIMLAIASGAIYSIKNKRKVRTAEVCGSYFQQIDNPEYITELEAYASHATKVV